MKDLRPRLAPVGCALAAVLADRHWWAVALASLLAMAVYLLAMCWLVTRPNTDSVETLLFKWRAAGSKPDEIDEKPQSSRRRWFRRKPPDRA